MKLWKLAPAVTALVLSTSANAALVERLGGLAYYDDVADLTWLTDAHAAGTNMNWTTANQWAADLVVGGNENWRLPSAFNFDSSGPCSGFNCTDSELGSLFYNVLGGIAGRPINQIHNSNYELFSNVMFNNNSHYWTATGNADNTSWAWVIDMSSGEVDRFNVKTDLNLAWAVQSGDVSAVPVPAALWLFGSGLLGLVGVASRKKVQQLLNIDYIKATFSRLFYCS